MSKRGVLYVYWGGDKYKKYLNRSIESVKKFHPELPIHVETLPDSATLLDKARMLDMTPFEETLFLDVDTVVLGRLDFGFDKAAQFKLACCICECPWARRYGGLSGDLIEYNTGVLFFTKAAKPLFDAWAEQVRIVDSSIKIVENNEIMTMLLNDQGGFAKAVEDLAFSPYVLPYNWNFRPHSHFSFYGPIKIWHDYFEIPKGVLDINAYYEQDDSIIQFAWINPPAGQK